ncbi:MAG: ribonuclease H [Pseudomonadota bacterium]
MSKILLFTDASVNPPSKIGYAAYLAIPDMADYSNYQQLSRQIKLKQFNNTSSTKLELQGLLWALSEIKSITSKIIVYTDCQNIIGLQQRRESLEKNNYHTKKGKLINNFELYQAFFKIIDLLDCSFIKVQGHQPSKYKDQMDKIFTLVDRASRSALKELLND